MTAENIKSRDLSISQLFEHFYVVPDYQREYVWTESEVERLLNDILDEYNPETKHHQEEYFIGSLVVCPRDDGRLDLIDGQQRLTTIFIILCATKFFLEQSTTKVPNQLNNQIASYATDSDGRDIPCFRVEIHYAEGQGILRMFAEPLEFRNFRVSTKSRSLDNLNTAFHTAQRFFQSNFGDNIEALLRFYAFITNNVKVIRIETQNLARALKVFETINDRGVGLDSMDLLKNLLFMNASKTEFDKLKEKWQNVVNLIYRNREKPLRFLRYFIFANFNEDRLREDEIYSWFVRNERKCGYASDPLQFIDRLYDSAYAYTQFLNGQFLDGRSNRYLENIKKLSGSSRQHLMLLLAASDMAESCFVELCRNIENLLFIYIVARESGREFERRFARWAPEVRRISNQNELDEFFQRRFLPEKERLYQRFILAFDEMNEKSLQKYRMRYVLAKINQFVNYNAFKRNSDLNLDVYLEKNVEIEHILPLSAEAGYKRHVAENEEAYDNAVQALGNLTLIEKPINASIGNHTFEEKKKGFKQSGFLLTKHLSEPVTVGTNTSVERAFDGVKYFDSWDIQTISKRQKIIRDLAIRTWDILPSTEK